MAPDSPTHSDPPASPTRTTPVSAVDARGAMGVQFGDYNTMYNEYKLMPAPTVSWPVVVSRAPRLAAAYLDRPAQRAALRAALSNPAVGTQAAVAVVTGGGGTGKTQLAADAFGHAQTSDGAYGVPRVDLAMWVSASSRSAIVSTYAQAYLALSPEMANTSNNPEDRGHKDGAKQAEAFLVWLTSTDKTWMVVLDDIADPADLAGSHGGPGLLPTGPSGAVILTTRRRDAAITGLGRRIDLDVFTPAESLDYFSGKLSAAPGLPADVLDDAGELADDLGHLPLALAQACPVIINDALSCRTYREKLAAHTLTEVFPVDHTVSGDDYPHGLIGTLALAVDRANEMDPIGLAEPLLRLAATLDPNGVPEDLFTSAAARFFLARVRFSEKFQAPVSKRDVRRRLRRWRGRWQRPHTEDVSIEEARRALRSLHLLSLLTHEPADGPRAVRMHALTQRATLERMPRGVFRAAVLHDADALAQIWPAVENDPARSLVLRANAATLVTRHPIILWAAGAHSVLFWAGISLGEAGLVTEAVAYFTDLTGQATDRLGTDHPDTLKARSQLAQWRISAGASADTNTAEELLSDCMRVLGPDDKNTFGARGYLAYSRGLTGDPAGAATATEELLTDQLRVLGPDNPSALATRNNFAYWQSEAGDPASAAASYTELLADKTRLHGQDDPGTLFTRANLASLRQEAGDLAGAIADFEEILTRRLRVLGPDHPDTMATRSFLASSRGQSGDPAGAATAIADLLADCLRVFGANQAITLSIRNNLALWRGHAGDPAGAATAFSEILTDCLQVIGADHVQTFITRANLARWRGEAGDPAGAAAATKELHSDLQRRLGADNPLTLTNRDRLGRWQGEAGDPTAAVTAFGELLTQRLRLLGPDHADTLTTRRGLARWQGEAGDPTTAATAYAELLTDCLRVLGPDHPDTLTTRQGLAHWRTEAGGLSG
jgi:hypothetical protein